MQPPSVQLSRMQPLMDFTQLKFWSVKDAQMMAHALDLAKQGMACGEVPVGAVLVCDGQIIGEGYNQPISCHDATAHAEIVAIKDACRRLQNYRLPAGTTLYVSLEPCTMCFGAMIHARVGRVVYATSEPKAGVVGSQLNLQAMPFYNHFVAVEHGLYQKNAADMLSDFFRQRRQQKKAQKQIAKA
ncbi:tRNA adenosine(34) deaminase TadA [Moraxella sp. ZJ142]|uniref:tRNA adenosine(34) deaminase TadA n=1 Tax=Moraxella marmotae TaxID=3344520 RepID=UPI0035D4FF11